MNNYRDKLIEAYFSSHHKYIMPKTKEEWDWVIQRIELNFGKVFATLSVNAKILDIACGIGYLEYYLLKKGFTNVEAIDLSQEQIEMAKECLVQYGLKFDEKIFFKTADVFSFLKDKEKNEKYDFISAIDLVDHLNKEEVFNLLELVYGALKPSGIFILRTTNMNNPFSSSYFYSDFTHETGFSISSLSQCLRACGFEKIKISYEDVPYFPEKKKTIISKIKQSLRPMKLWAAGKLLGIDPCSLSEDLVAIIQK